MKITEGELRNTIRTVIKEIFLNKQEDPRKYIGRPIRKDSTEIQSDEMRPSFGNRAMMLFKDKKRTELKNYLEYLNKNAPYREKIESCDLSEIKILVKSSLRNYLKIELFDSERSDKVNKCLDYLVNRISVLLHMHCRGDFVTPLIANKQAVDIFKRCATILMTEG